MEYRIENRDRHLDVSISADAVEQEQLLEHYMNNCRDRRCDDGSCENATDEYNKVDRINIQPTTDGVLLQLIAKPGETLNSTEIEPCLEHNFAMSSSLA
ncbi:hypothetical protein [Candidatus Reidiella endopervernicosa]|nr:hypothetical protein [Candidatus Reidiella endopervernicosa]QKQ25921.1 hypothetical protein HUE57_06205 [Candidatus Reidiella endopervernicosa]